MAISNTRAPPIPQTPARTTLIDSDQLNRSFRMTVYGHGKLLPVFHQFKQADVA
jgi:hypothetical protein